LASQRIIAVSPLLSKGGSGGILPSRNPLERHSASLLTFRASRASTLDGYTLRPIPESHVLQVSARVFSKGKDIPEMNVEHDRDPKFESGVNQGCPRPSEKVKAEDLFSPPSPTV